MNHIRLFDNWADRYDEWFTTPLGELIKEYENELIIGLLKPRQGEKILDAGCGTGVFTVNILEQGAYVFGVDISFPMLSRAGEKLADYAFFKVLGDITYLPFPDSTFDKVASITALEFIEDAGKAIEELFRVTKKGGSILVATLNSMSPWAARRRVRARNGQSPLFEKVIFRSPDELRALVPVDGMIKTAIHFRKDDGPDHARKIELQGREHDLHTGAFLVAHWEKE